MSKKARKVFAVAGVGLLSVSYLAFMQGSFDEYLAGDNITEELPEDNETVPDNLPPWSLALISLGTSLGISGVAALTKKAINKARVKTLNKEISKLTKTPINKLETKATAELTAKVLEQQVAKKAIESGAVKAAQKAAQEAVAKEADVAVRLAAEKAAVQAARAGKSAAEAAQAAKAAKAAAKSGKAAKLMKNLTGGPAQIIIAIIAAILSEILKLDPDSFKPCDGGEFDLSSLPDWAKAIISSVPFLGELFDLLGPTLCMKAGCPPGTQEKNGLCYKDCATLARDNGRAPGDWTDDGATLCYRRYEGFDDNVNGKPSNGQGHTITSITKNTILDTGVPVSSCPASHPDRDGALCYEKTPPGWRDVGKTLWEDCRADEHDGGVFCAKYVAAGTPVQLEGCPPGWSNDGLTCREPISCPSWKLWECSGGKVIGRLDNGGTCPDGKEKVDGLCYDKCPAGTSRTPGMPYECSRRNKASRVRDVKPLVCGDDQEQRGGLCYKREIPAGYAREVDGLLTQQCPPGSKNYGVGCERESISRGAGTIPFSIRMKPRVDDFKYF